MTLKINSVSNINFGTRSKEFAIAKTVNKNSSTEDVFAVRNRINGVYQYEKNCLAGLYINGFINEPTYIKRRNELEKQYINRLHQHGLNAYKL